MIRRSDFQRWATIMESQELETWVAGERKKVLEYLTTQGVERPNVGDWPAFEVAPCFAIWAVESKKAPGRIGWWAFSGDCPTDYVSEDGKCHPRNALKILLGQWLSYIPHMKKGKHPPGTTFGSARDLAQLGELLEKRAALLSKWLADDSLWAG